VTPPESDRWKCGQCGGRLELEGHDATDASATEYFVCARCDSTGRVDFFHGPDSPRWSGAVVPNTDEYNPHPGGSDE
jgi:DNA-directed RNA polymerase subunit RPC12/RpoP